MNAALAGVSGAILAGGRSRRMGRDKAWIPFDGRPLIAVVIGILRPLFAELVVVAADARPYAGLGIPVHTDQHPGQGPLAAIGTALRESHARRAFCLGCDMPFACPSLIAYLCEMATDADVVVPRTSKGYEPLHAVYDQSCLPRLDEMLSAGNLRTDALYSRVRVHGVSEAELRRHDPELRSFTNINTPSDLEAALGRARSCSF